MKKGIAVLSLAVLCLFNLTVSHAESVHSEDLPADQSKVIVTFEGEIQEALVAQYGQVLKTIGIINGVVAVINTADIELLKLEEGVKDVAIVSKAKALPAEARSLNQDYRLKLRAASKEFRRLRHEKMRELIHGLIAQYRQRLINRYEFRALLHEGRAAIDEEIEQLIQQQVGIILEWNLQEPGIAVANGPGTEVGAWDTYSVNGSGIVIAILDTGVNYTLADLDMPNYLGGYDFFNDDADPIDDNWDLANNHYGHGTLVSTIAVAQGEEKIIGAAPAASYYALKVLGNDATGDLNFTIEALDWCVNVAAPKPDIVSMSFGNPGTDPGWENFSVIFEAAVNAAYDAGIILVAASGNDGNVNSGYPARYTNVVSVGGHAVDQTLYDYGGFSTNGGVDIVAPGELIPSMDMTGDATWHYDGTSMAAPHVAGLLALQLQFARQNNIEINNGYQWESVKHSAEDLPLETDPVFEGKGKARAKENIRLTALSWPLENAFAYSNEAFWWWDQGYYVPAFYIGTNLYQDITLTNNTLILGNYPDDIENLDVTATQAYFIQQNEALLPGSPVTEFFPPSLSLTAGDFDTLANTYYIPGSTLPGLDRTRLDYNFNLTSAPGRLIEVGLPYASIWCPPAEINPGYPTE